MNVRRNPSSLVGVQGPVVEGIPAVLAHQLESDRAMFERIARFKAEFLGNVSHELRTPLNIIRGNASLLAGYTRGSAQAEHVQAILEATHDLEHHVKSMLDLADALQERFALDPRSADVAELVSEAEAILHERAADRGVRVHVLTTPCPAFLDAGKVLQVLYEYLSNAIKFSPPGGNIWMRCLMEDGSVRIEVEDEGIGIAEEDMAELFVAFRQISEGRGKQVQGLGIGLALARNLVTAMGGKVGVHSQPGQGSTFYALMPVER